ncbi:MAG: ABC transporter ATP-binding protein [Sweet potato little leaf phytoplasma]|uniref:ABC-type spermidine/putrescine transport system, ATPase component n=2 Tax=Candidatus Phytoplasma TaxID=33926 RepID=A0ABN0J7J5_PEWBP|nr:MULTISPECIES: ABC transporter ATP-binding protein [Phytoplasma]MDV3139168.1 ABC transporter ATP-binding protein [Candidatus Phytoplasma australasiaticum]QLL37046.1 ABC-type spermidine/putrescine transport system, ATPase component ['Echinacea purpurea' witches'-broom phytoplasma]WEX20589.1 MAG: ABC-type spermidine/putrescine transport system ATPase component [Candidatus Phytoplasma aurantifolia]EMR14429.1 ABC-type spermidine/putrescine transport system, ATPase component [Peanut witches'-broom
MTNLIELKNITKVINNQIILKDINLKIKTNEFVTILGPSGCGKTTILKIIGGFDTCSSGDIFFKNKSILNVPPHKRLINTVFQNYSLFPHLNVLENIAFGLRVKDLNYETKQKIKSINRITEQKINLIKEQYKHKIKIIQDSFNKNYLLSWLPFYKENPKIRQLKIDLKEEIKIIQSQQQLILSQLHQKLLCAITKEEFIKNKVLHYLKLVGLQGFENRNIYQLSGGQQQRVAIARALINEPEVALFDEPLAALDLKSRQEMQYELKEMQKIFGITFIVVTHDQSEALTMSDKIVVIKQGAIQQIGNPEDIYNEPANKFIAQFIGESNLISGIMKDDFVVLFDNKEFRCIDYGFRKNQIVDIVIRPEDIDIVDYKDGLITGIVHSISFKGVYWEVIIQTKYRNYLIHTTDFIEKNTKIGISFNPEDIHIMETW